MGEFGTGHAVRRVEDEALLRGEGRYLDDIAFENAARAVFVRSPHAHARIRSIDTDEARSMPGVLAIYTGADVNGAIAPLPSLADAMFEFKRKDGSPRYKPDHPVLAGDFVRNVGEPVTMVVAESVAAAKDAAEAIVVDYGMLPSITDTGSAAGETAPQLFPDAPGNVAFEVEVGERDATEAAFADAAHVASVDLINNRLVAATLEPRSAAATYEAGSGQYTLFTGCQSVYRLQTLLSKMLGIGQDKLRVVSPDTGGSFGMKAFTYPEQPMVLWAARHLRRPVKWVSERSEAFVSDVQGRDLVSHAELALDADGRFLALRARTTGTVGAYYSNFGPMIVSFGNARLMCGVYDLPALHAEVQVVFTNKVFTDAYRGAGRPEASYVIERLVDIAARRLNIEPAELRRRNFIKPHQMPYRGPTGIEFDSGNFAVNLDAALMLADAEGFGERRKDSRSRGRLRGLGISTYIESTAGNVAEQSQIRVDPGGTIEVAVGAHPSGQGHATAFAQVAAERLGVPFESVTVRMGDTDLMPSGGGTGGSRSAFSSGGAVLDGAARIEDKGRRIAALLLEAAESDIEFGDGAFTIKGTDRRVGLFEVARAAHDRSALPEGFEPGLEAAGDYTPPAATFPNGCHVCEVEIDPDTGVTEIKRYSVADDFGRVLNPMIVEGQVHGGIAQGVGQALTEHCLYDEDSGQLVTGSFMDYGVPRADHLPSIAFTTNNVPCRTNTLGAKGAGEAGTTGACSAVVNAIVDALAPFGIDHIDMPATPEAVWRAIQSAKPR